MKAVLNTPRNRSSLNCWLVAVIAACAGLSGCAMAPGMKMTSPVESSTSETGAQPGVQDSRVPISTIDAALIARMKEGLSRTSSRQIQSLLTTAEPYTLGKGDVLQITVWDHPELVQAQGPIGQAAIRPSDPVPGFVIDQDGNLDFPYVGPIHVEGLKPEQVQRRLAVALAQVFVKPQVTVRVASFRAKQIYVDGEVHAPGALPLNDIPMTLYDAVNRAGGFASTADQSRMVLVRGGRSYSVDLTGMLDEGLNPAKILLKNGDLLRVVARDENGVFVMGEVNKPVTAVPMKSGRLTLSEAIAQAGSLNNSTADASEVYVIRDSMSPIPQIFHLEAKSPVSMILANQFELNPRDVVYVDSNGLVRFSRVLSLLLPAVNAALTGAIVTK
ncbi:polysaccharide export outer membrane protein [Paraburkholderia steynii]|uniref:Polysaccharide export outer membrane protein n=1 Tax=Paraburkholderia steynii TaxID=1245441 RepID=A0A7Z7BG91_9BURK|nr:MULTISPECIES: polysaccharide biosynthesis/export family protein [Paraburkholderia]SDI96746.1 polysaccharide export outer membrane protein [Paraburkholderia steynii]